MKKIQTHTLDLWQFERLAKEASINHFVTQRSSLSGGQEFTLSYSSHPDREVIIENRKVLAKAMGVSPRHLFLPYQVHETRIIRVHQGTTEEELRGTDALITNEKGICIAVMSADCVPILLYDVTNQAIGAVHSGWRGTVAKILDKTLVAMRSAFGTRPQDVVAGIGPSVCRESYEVGTEVMDAVCASFGKDNNLIEYQSETKGKLDLWEANRRQLLEFGVSPSHIEISHLCTVKNNDLFFSARRGDSGRFAAGIVLLQVP